MFINLFFNYSSFCYSSHYLNRNRSPYITFHIYIPLELTHRVWPDADSDYLRLTRQQPFPASRGFSAVA